MEGHGGTPSLTSRARADRPILGVERVETPAGRFWFGIDASGDPIAGFEALGPPPVAVRRTPTSWSLVSRLERHFAGALDTFADLPLPRGSPFQRACWHAVRGSVPGSRLSYGELALLAGRPAAARAVGGAMRRNPAPLLVPCHRVVAADGSIGGYAGSWGAGTVETLVKQAILDFETSCANRTQSSASAHR
jgi:methylated-DNA-[protein]-cysteine S-methyltransferase